MDEIDTTESLNVLFSYVMKQDDEWNFYCDILKLANKDIAKPLDKDEKAEYIKMWSESVVISLLREKKIKSLSHELAKNSVARAKVMLEPDDSALVQQIFDMRKSYLMKYAVLERLFMERV